MYLKRFGRYFKYLKPVRLQFAAGLGAGLIAAGASGAGLPFVIKFMVPFVTADKGPEGVALVLTLLVVPLVFSLRALGTFFNSYFMSYAGMHVLESLRLLIFRKLQELPLGFFQRNTSGDLMSRVMGDTSQLREALIRVVNSLVKEPATLLSAIAFLVYLSIEQSETIFMLIALASVPACVLPIKLIGARVLSKATRTQKEAGTVTAVLNENLASLREIRAYNLEDRECNRFSEACRTFFRYALKTVKYQKALSPLIELVSSLAIVLALYVAIQKDVPPEVLASILTALYMCYQPIKKLGTVSNTIRKAEASLNRLEYILHAPDFVPEPARPVPFEKARGEIRFDNVSFSYSEEIVLKSINVNIAPGEAVALVGPSGAGKTTFANLVPRFYDPIEGTVRIDGVDLRDLRKADLRAQVALVSQETVLFGDTIANNIRLGRPEAGLQEIREAARMAHADVFIENFEDGYETRVGERGSRLSGGQRQRIAIARAFLKDAPIIILDEPTAALDATSEQHIQSALEALAKGRTVLIIAHRFSTIQHADRIFVFDAGRIVASGAHKELHKTNPLYKSLYDTQAKTALTEPDPST
ncbi:MAG: ABC transporter ATP-binding protein [Opitutales bacterium]